MTDISPIHFIKYNSSFTKSRKINDSMVASDALNAKILPEKTYVIVDSFNKEDLAIDIDGDGKNDLTHGDYICRLIKSLNPNAKAIPFHLSSLNDYDYNKKRYNGLLKFLNKVKPDAVNRSISNSRPLSLYNQDKNSLIENKEEVRKSLEKRPMDALTLSNLEKIIKSGFKLFNSEGNRGDDNFSTQSLVDGIQMVGSTDAQRNILPFSEDIKTMKFAQGRYGVSEIKDDNGKVLGYDLVGNGKIAVKADEVSSKGTFVRPAIKQFVGKSPEEYLVPDEKYELLYEFFNESDREKFKKKWGFTSFDEMMNEIIDIRTKYLFTIEQAQNISNIDKMELGTIKDQGIYVNSKNCIFDVDEEGKLVYDPDRSGRKNVINYIDGNSFASPTRMVIVDIMEANK
ncbi:MAG: hypothetical protein AB7V50_10660 [Vampirovibrionia bacterium]